MNHSASKGPRAIDCDYCGNPAEAVSGKTIYPHRPDLHGKNMYRCVPCNARVGCHDGTWVPLGRLADAKLRTAKQAAHAVFDPIWQAEAEAGTPRGQARNRAYAWLAEKLGIARERCHIGMFDVETCYEVVKICKNRERKNYGINLGDLVEERAFGIAIRGRVVEVHDWDRNRVTVQTEDGSRVDFIAEFCVVIEEAKRGPVPDQAA